MNEPDEITVSYEFSAVEHVQALYTLSIGRISRVVQITSASIAIGGSALMVVAAWIAGKPAEGIVAALSLLPLGVIWWFVPVGLRALDVRRFRRETPDGTTQVRRFGPRGFSASADGPLIPWGLISEVRETPEAYLIADASSMTRVSMPKRALSHEENRLFRSLVEKEFAHRPKQLKLRKDHTVLIPDRT